MENYLKKYGMVSIIISLTLTILSLFLIFKPQESISIVMRVAGIVLFVSGIVHLVSYFSASKDFRKISFELIQGILSVIIGIIVFVNPIIIISILQIAIGCWIIVESVLRMQVSFGLKKEEFKSWNIILIFAIFTLLIGIVILFNPFATLASITTICGSILLITEIINIVETVIVIIKQ